MSRIDSFADIVAGQEIPALTVPIDRLALVRYAGAADDYVRQHWDHPFMVEQGYPDVIGHGWLTFAHMCRAVTDWAPPDLATIARYAVRYHRPLHPGLLLCGGKVTAADEADAEIEIWGRSEADELIASGTISILPFLR